MRTFRGAEWVGPAEGPRVLLLAAEPGSGQRWAYTYSPSPGVTVTVVTMPGPGQPDPADPVFARIVLSLVRQPP